MIEKEFLEGKTSTAGEKTVGFCLRRTPSPAGGLASCRKAPFGGPDPYETYPPPFNLSQMSMKGGGKFHRDSTDEFSQDFTLLSAELCNSCIPIVELIIVIEFILSMSSVQGQNRWEKEQSRL